jgi:hypothetical protein
MALILTGSSGSTTLDSSAGLTFSDTSNQSAAASPYVLKNRIINGAMQIWQRGTSFSGNVYTADRWIMGNNPTSIVQSTDVPTGFQYSLDVTGANHLINQKIESYNILDTYGQSLTVSFWAKNVSGTNTLTVQIGTPSALNNFAIQNIEQTSSAITISSSWVRYSVTFTSLSSSVSNGAFIYIYRNGSTSTDETRITGVQLEIGSSATPFERRLYDKELISCQRYYQTYAQPALRGVVTSASNINRAAMSLPVTMRVAPTGTMVGNLPCFDGVTAGTVSNLSATYSTASVIEYDLTTNGGLTAYRPGLIYQSGSSANYLTLSAEL